MGLAQATEGQVNQPMREKNSKQFCPLDGLADFIVGAEFGGANDGGYARVFVSQTPPTLKGDVDLDGDIDFGDVGPFIAVLQAGDFQAEADCDCSTVVDFGDISAFIAILQSQ